jgi:hypothetical protein
MKARFQSRESAGAVISSPVWKPMSFDMRSGILATVLTVVLIAASGAYVLNTSTSTTTSSVTTPSTRTVASSSASTTHSNSLPPSTTTTTSISSSAPAATSSVSTRSSYRFLFSAGGLGSGISGLILNVDGVDYSFSQLPFTFNLQPGSSHTYRWYSIGPLGSNLVVYQWESILIQWYTANGIFMQTTSFANSGSFTASYPSNFTASYAKNYAVTLAVSPTNAGTLSYGTGLIAPGGSTSTSTTILLPAYPPGSLNTPSLGICASAGAGYGFASWSSSSPSIVIGSSASCAGVEALIYGGGTITANFYPVSTTTTSGTSSNSATTSHPTTTTLTTPSSTTASTSSQSTSQTSTTPASVTIVASVHFYILNKTGCTQYVCSWFSQWVVTSGNQAIWEDYSPVNTGNVSYTLSFSCLYYMQWYFPLSPTYPYTAIEFTIQAQNGTVYLDQSATAPNSLAGTWQPPCVNTPSTAPVALPPAFAYAIPAFMLIAAIVSGLRETDRDQVSDSESHCLRRSWRP